MDSKQDETPEFLRETLSEYQSLVRSRGWGLLVELARGQIEVRGQMVLAMEEKGLEDILEGVRLRAEIRAIKLFTSLPETVIDRLKEDLNYVADEAETVG